MAYINYEYFKSLYGETLTEADFNRLSWEAEREIDKATSGVDGIKKLRVAFPTNEYDAENVKRCVAELVNFLYKLDLVNNRVHESNGVVHGSVIKSVSAGNESITYETSGMLGTATSSIKNRDMTIMGLISSRLSGTSDANGINLLFGGRYPYGIVEV